MDEAILDSDNYFRRVVGKLRLSHNYVELGERETAEILLGKCELSQRSYNVLRRILQTNNVDIPSYDKVRAYIADIDVGPMTPLHESSDCNCMGYGCSVSDTLQRIVNTPALYSSFDFFSSEQQVSISSFLKKHNADLYAQFDASKPTIFIRETGDNFRAASRFPTEQTSFSIMNMKDMLNCPYGQFISTLWRGSENRKMLELHCQKHYDELAQLGIYFRDHMSVGGAV